MRVAHILKESTGQWTVAGVIEDILGAEHVFFVPKDPDFDLGNIPRNKYIVQSSWTRGQEWMFSDMDCDPGEGAICVPNEKNTDPQSLAKAAHEAYHALLHKRGKNHQNEHLVNRLAEQWVRRNLSRKDYKEAMKAIEASRASYAGRKYEPSIKRRQHLTR